MDKYKVDIDNVVVQGTAKDIVTHLRKKRFLGQNISLEDFMIEMSENVWKLFGISIAFDRDPNVSIEDKCEQFMKCIKKHGLLKFVD